ncbi:leucine-rich repeat protein [Mycoplasma sp. CSL7475-4]|uniref:transglutaminase domain-containing protein n=1 Tax=Mycoplasma sp. CSL7475-4 TaxID=2973942 RepID=UPI00216ACBA7|nr:transglutaminase domain-containing protein [Mycoplasma sp. CSL7475-4]MCS4536778.1 leucine-rich repeat protein [Mycoplasma sp. CSL7475-4]
MKKRSPKKLLFSIPLSLALNVMAVSCSNTKKTSSNNEQDDNNIANSVATTEKNNDIGEPKNKTMNVVNNDNNEHNKPSKPTVDKQKPTPNDSSNDKRNDRVNENNQNESEKTNSKHTKDESEPVNNHQVGSSDNNHGSQNNDNTSEDDNDTKVQNTENKDVESDNRSNNGQHIESNNNDDSEKNEQANKNTDQKTNKNIEVKDNKDENNIADDREHNTDKNEKQQENTVDFEQKIAEFEVKLTDLRNELSDYLSSTKNEAKYKYEEVVDLLQSQIYDFKFPTIKSDNEFYLNELRNYYDSMSSQFNQIKSLKESLKDSEDAKPEWAGDNYNKLAQKKHKQESNPLLNYPEVDAINASLKDTNRRVNPQNAFINNQAIKFLNFGGNEFIEKFSEINYTPAQRQKVNEFLHNSIVKESMTKNEKIEAIFDWITNNIKYANAKNRPHINPWEIIEYRYAVCGGFSNLYKEMLDLIGVNSVMVIGWSSAGDHQWVLVQDPQTHEWFYSDPTWGTIQKRYFRMNSEQISNDHRVIRVLNYTLTHNQIQYEYWKGLAIKNALSEHVVIPDLLGDIKVENIANTLLNNENLKTLQIGKYVTNIEYKGMQAQLESFNVDEGNSVYAYSDAMLYTKDLSEILVTPAGYQKDKITISKYTKTLSDGKELFNIPLLKFIEVEPGNYSFASYKGLLYNNDYSQLISIPDGATKIYIHPLTKLSGQEISFKENVEEVYLEQGITNIPDFTFNYLPKLKKVYLPASINHISEYAFVKISNITLVTDKYNSYVSDYAKSHGFRYEFEK